MARGISSRRGRSSQNPSTSAGGSAEASASPILSIILSVYNTSPYLQQCLSSISAHEGGEIEIIAVDDGSTDQSASILEGHAKEEPRLRVFRQPENGGAGPARNAGLKMARGDYVWFVDSDDWIAGEAVSRILRALEAKPEVLLFGWSRVFQDGRVSPCPAYRSLASAPKSFALHEWPEAIGILHTPWNKVVRRELLERTGYQFSRGWYQDLSFTYLTLAAAKRISTLPDTLLFYRQHSGAATRTLNRAHLAVLKQWEQVFDLVQAHSPEPELLRVPLFDRMTWHLLEVLKKADRLPADALPEFAVGMRHLWKTQAPTAYRGPPGIEGLELRLLRSGHAGVRLIRLATRTQARLRKAFGLPHRPYAAPSKGAPPKAARPLHAAPK